MTMGNIMAAANVPSLDDLMLSNGGGTGNCYNLTTGGYVRGSGVVDENAVSISIGSMNASANSAEAG